MGANYKIKPNTPIECLLLNIDKIIRKQQNSVSPSFPASIPDNSPFLWGDVVWVATSILNQIFNIIEFNSTMKEDIVNWFSNLWAYMVSPRIRKEYVGLLYDLDIFVSIEKWRTTIWFPVPIMKKSFSTYYSFIEWNYRGSYTLKMDSYIK